MSYRSNHGNKRVARTVHLILEGKEAEDAQNYKITHVATDDSSAANDDTIPIVEETVKATRSFIFHDL